MSEETRTNKLDAEKASGNGCRIPRRFVEARVTVPADVVEAAEAVKRASQAVKRVAGNTMRIKSEEL